MSDGAVEQKPLYVSQLTAKEIEEDNEDINRALVEALENSKRLKFEVKYCIDILKSFSEGNNLFKERKIKFSESELEKFLSEEENKDDKFKSSPKCALKQLDYYFGELVVKDYELKEMLRRTVNNLQFFIKRYEAFEDRFHVV